MKKINQRWMFGWVVAGMVLIATGMLWLLSAEASATAAPSTTTNLISQIQTGGVSSCALFHDGRVACWGSNAFGQLGLGISGGSIGGAPGDMGFHLSFVDLGTNRTAIQISLHLYHVCAILDNLGLKCWGYNYYGQLGYENTADVGFASNQMGDSLPLVSLNGDSKVKLVVAGYLHTCAILKATNDLQCWGYNYYGQLGYGLYDGTDFGAENRTMGNHLPVVQLGSGQTAKKNSTRSRIHLRISSVGRH